MHPPLFSQSEQEPVFFRFSCDSGFHHATLSFHPVICSQRILIPIRIGIRPPIISVLLPGISSNCSPDKTPVKDIPRQIVPTMSAGTTAAFRSRPILNRRQECRCWLQGRDRSKVLSGLPQNGFPHPRLPVYRPLSFSRQQSQAGRKPPSDQKQILS